jgi:hypothetical protein
MNPMGQQLVGINVLGFTVGDWCPTPDGSGKPEAVGISVQTEHFGDIVIRLKTPERVDEVIQMLLRHKRDVWPDAK